MSSASLHRSLPVTHIFSFTAQVSACDSHFQFLSHRTLPVTHIYDFSAQVSACDSHLLVSVAQGSACDSHLQLLFAQDSACDSHLQPKKAPRPHPTPSFSLPFRTVGYLLLSQPNCLFMRNSLTACVLTERVVGICHRTPWGFCLPTAWGVGKGGGS